VQLQNFGHRDQECRKLQIGYHNKISSRKFLSKLFELSVKAQKHKKLKVSNIKADSQNKIFFAFGIFQQILIFSQEGS